MRSSVHSSVTVVALLVVAVAASVLSLQPRSGSSLASTKKTSSSTKSTKKSSSSKESWIACEKGYSCTATKAPSGNCMPKKKITPPKGKIADISGTCGITKCSGQCYRYVKGGGNSSGGNKSSASGFVASSPLQAFNSCPTGYECQGIVKGDSDAEPCRRVGFDPPQNCAVEQTNIFCGIASIPNCRSTCVELICAGAQ